MSSQLTEAKLLLAGNKTEQATKDFMATEQGNALTEGYAVN